MAKTPLEGLLGKHIADHPFPKPVLHLRGNDAKKIHAKAKPGDKVKLHVHGTITSLGVDRYDPKRPAEASVEIDDIKFPEPPGSDTAKEETSEGE